MQVELNLAFLLNFSRKLVFVKNDVETLFFLKTGFKIGVRIIHRCALYTGKYGSQFAQLCSWDSHWKEMVQVTNNPQKSCTVEPRFNELPRDRGNTFVISRIC